MTVPGAAARMQRPRGQFLDRRGLLEACAIEGTPFLRPHAAQSLFTIKQLLLDRCAPPARASLLVLAVDGIAFDVAAAVWSPDALVPLTSTFPSTSSTAWVTALTGLTPEEHLVPGVIYYDPDHASLYNALEHSSLGPDGEWRAEGRRGSPSYPTLFAELSLAGVESVANPGDLSSLRAPWPRAMLAGARVEVPAADQDGMRRDPRAMVETAIRDAERAVEQRGREARRLVWTYVNLDAYVHHHGYDAVMIESLQRLEAAAMDWTSRGHCVVAHSDHGLVANRSDDALDDAWQALNRTSCRLPPGGAGRVLWCYPRTGRESEVFDRACAALGEHALVLYREELRSRGILAIGPALAKMIGEVVVLATGERFPAVGGRPFEHGSLLPGEMLAALAVWAAEDRDGL